MYVATKGSGKKLNFICPFCNNIKKNKIPIYRVVKERGISCVNCNDHISFPNKFACVLFGYLESINVIQNYQCEYCPQWVKPHRYRYDNYFEYDNKQYIVEMDGELGHGKRSFGCNSNDADVDGLARDIIKDELAKENNIILIRINSTKSNFDYLKNECINNIICVSDNTNKIDWGFIETNCYRNTYKEINDYYMNKEKSISKIKEKFKVSSVTVFSILNKYNKLGLNDYVTFIEKFKNKYSMVVDMYNSGMKVEEIANATNIQGQSITKYLRRAHNLGECNYIPESNKKMVSVYKDNKYINTYPSISELSRKSTVDLGVHLNISEISYVCSGKNKQAKGYTFSFVS